MVASWTAGPSRSTRRRSAAVAAAVGVAAAAAAVEAAAVVVVAAAGDGRGAMNRGFTGGKRSREANRDLKKREKEARLQRNRELRARGLDPDVSDIAEPEAPLPEVKLED